MQVHWIGWKISGFYRLASYGLRWAMDETQAQRRYRILNVWQKHGLEATLEAFHLSRRTLFNWQARLAEQGGNISADEPEVYKEFFDKLSQTKFQPLYLNVKVRR